jgi:hypothetical protein
MVEGQPDSGFLDMVVLRTQALVEIVKEIQQLSDKRCVVWVVHAMSPNENFILTGDIVAEVQGHR